MYFTVYTVLGSGGGGRDGRKQYLTIEVFQYMFLLYYFIKAMGWGGGGADLIILVICTFWGVRGGGGCRATCLFLVLRLRRRGVFLVLVQNFSARGLVQKP